MPGHPCATAALAFLSHPSRVTLERPDVSTLEAATAYAVRLALVGHPHEAACACADALTCAAEGSAGWLLPVEPLLRPTAHPDLWAPVLAPLRERAL